MSSSPDPAPRHAVAIVGPTAAGKGRLAVEAAERLGLPIFVCDSVKVYRGLDIGSAKPSAELQGRIPHELIDLVDPDQSFSAGAYAGAAWSRLDARGAIFCGGTGFYLRSTIWTQSGDATSSEDRERREAFEREWLERESESEGAIFGALSAMDPDTAAAIHPRNVVRTLRALWLCQAYGRPVSQVRREDPPRPRLDALVVVLDPGADAVDAAIERRIDAMLAAGWLAEVEKLRDAGYDARHKAMNSLGYRQLLDVVEGRSTLADGRRAVASATRQYARRQRTYFRRQLGVPCVWIRDARQCPWGQVEAFVRGGVRG